MRLPIELLWLSFPYLSIASAVPKRNSAEFASLRGLTQLTVDYSNPTKFTQPNKFFHESRFSTHYDGRFAAEELPDSTRPFHLRLLLRSYTIAMNQIGVRTWLMHGCLLGWWWNGHIMPWDVDIDVMVDEKSINKLGNWWNMTVHDFRASQLGEKGVDPEDEDPKKKYLLEVNPHFKNTSTTDKSNVIDARWIDTSTGLFIDITTIHVAPVPSSSNPFSGNDNDDHDNDVELYTKDQHSYSYNQIFPLRRSTFESVTVHVPYAYEELLLEEYGQKALTDTHYHGYVFDAEKKEWLYTQPPGQVKLSLEDKHNRDRFLIGRRQNREMASED